MMALPGNRGGVGDLAASLALLAGGADCFEIISQI
jgi:hypothetical protein